MSFLVATLERYPIPEFLTSIPIRKTRAGLQFTCAAATLSEKRDVWVCNSDGYVGQVCIMSLYPEPNVTSCNGVCNARILCVASVPAYSSGTLASSGVAGLSGGLGDGCGSGSTPSPKSLTSFDEQAQQLYHQQHQRNSLPSNSYTQQLLDYRKSISPNYSPSSTLNTLERRRSERASATGSSAVAASSAAGSSVCPNGSSSSLPVSVNVRSSSSSGDVQLELNLSSSDEEATAAQNNGSLINSHSINTCIGMDRVPSPAPSNRTTGSTSTTSTAAIGSSSTLYHGHQVDLYTLTHQ